MFRFFFKGVLTLFFALTVTQYTWSQIAIPSANDINTIAGNGQGGFSGMGGQATSASFNPTAVAVDSAGNIYIADYSYNEVLKVTKSTGVISTLAGTGSAGYTGDGGAATSATLHGPIQVAVDGAGNVYIADLANHVIRKVDATTGDISTVAGDGTYGDGGDGEAATSATLGTDGVAVDGAGNIYIATADMGVVREVDAATGVISTIAGDSSAACVTLGDGGPATSAGLCGPISLGVDAAGNVYIATYADNRIRKVTVKTGIITTVAGDGTSGFSGDSGAATSAELYEPNGVAVDAAGDIYIADSLNQRIRLVTASTGTITTVAGNGTSGFTGDGGAATSAEFDGPVAVAADLSGTMYVADDFNGRVRAIGAAPVTGYVDPKYVVLAVQYAPPGSSSHVIYSSNTTVGTSTSLDNAFNSSTSVTTTLGGGFKIFGIGANGTEAATTSFTQSEDSNSSVAINTSATLSTELPGPGSSAVGVDHDYDVVWTWLNPKLKLTTTSSTSNLLWDGYAYDSRDDAGTMELVVLYLTWLENPSTIPSYYSGRLSRSWDTALGGLTSTDYTTIAARDPFSADPSFDPNADSSGRFDMEVNQTFAYQPPPQGGQPVTQGYTLTYGTTSTQGQSVTDTYTTGWVTDVSTSSGFSLGAFSATINDDMKNSTSATWTNKWSSLTTGTTSQGASLSITGPQYSDGYTGATELQVWKDNVYGTFMFYPVE